MATDDSDIREYFEKCVQAANVGNQSVNPKMANLKAATKMLKGAGFSHEEIQVFEASVFMQFAPKTGKKEVSQDDFVSKMLRELAAKYIEKKKKRPAKPDEKEQLTTQYKEKITAANQAEKNKTTASTKSTTADRVTGRLTDVKGYTASHKERFDKETGRGKGKEGRETKVENTGYTGQYRNKDTYDKTH